MSEEKIYGVVDNIESPGDDVFVSVNGTNYQIKDGIPCLVPVAVVDAIKHCTITKWKFSKDRTQPPILTTIQRYRFNQVTAPLSESDTEEEKAKQDLVVEMLGKKREDSEYKRKSGSGEKDEVVPDDVEPAPMDAEV